MKIKSTLTRALSALTPSTMAVATAVLLAGGLSACDNKEERADGAVGMQDRADNTQNTTPNNSSSTSPNNATGSMQDTSSDAWITTKVKTALLEDSLTKGFEIQVTTVDGVVSLDGKVQSAEALTHAQKIASDVKGVTKVDASGLVAN